jgi:hypothetical protein
MQAVMVTNLKEAALHCHHSLCRLHPLLSFATSLAAL